ncbi:hypothetical protein D3880_13180 [Pseudomonas cavernae]|uniref:Uncharacterized protein n=1 Tax=Pseudomonas cavernae TaxID=2320867 RepID=A0A385Z3K1_9PSED|nr:type III secretion system co-regulatory protein PtrC [Pseudomonas cavernae]AYC33241.1 hypothetical protein D3880_13180 [Pseudomonas cavernae]
MTVAQNLSSPPAYGVTYASLENCELRFESELAFQMDDGSLLTLHLPTSPGERQAIQQAVWQQFQQAAN